MLNLDDWKFKAGATALVVIILISHGSIWYATRQHYKRKQAEAVAAATLAMEQRLNVFLAGADAAALDSAQLHGQLTAKEADIATLKAKFQAERTKRLAAEALANGIAHADTPEPTVASTVILPQVEINLRVELADCTNLTVLLDEALTTSKTETLAVRKEVTQYKGLDGTRLEAIKQLNINLANETKVKGYWRTGFWATAGSTAILFLLRK